MGDGPGHKSLGPPEDPPVDPAVVPGENSECEDEAATMDFRRATTTTRTWLSPQNHSGDGIFFQAECITFVLASGCWRPRPFGWLSSSCLSTTHCTGNPFFRCLGGGFSVTTVRPLR